MEPQAANPTSTSPPAAGTVQPPPATESKPLGSAITAPYPPHSPQPRRFCHSPCPAGLGLLKHSTCHSSDQLVSPFGVASLAKSFPPLPTQLPIPLWISPSPPKTYVRLSRISAVRSLTFPQP